MIAILAPPAKVRNLYKKLGVLHGEKILLFRIWRKSFAKHRNTGETGDSMKEIGLWIDRHKAIIVIFSDDSEEIKNVHAGESEGFYEKVVSIVHDADSIRIFGPDEAKGELGKSLECKGVGNVTVDTTESVRSRYHI